MTFNPDADISGHRTRRRGRTAAVAGGGVVGLGAIAVLVVSLLSGGEIDLSPFLGGGTGDQGSSSSEGTLDECDSGADANAKVECRIAGSQVALDEYWSGQLDGYTEPGMIVVDGQASTACGTASNAVGPFYCPADATVYIDPTFFAVMQQQFGASAGDLAQLYIVGHEWGHHIQNTTGTMAEYPNNGTGPASNGVRMELQADCYAGAWIGDMTEATDADGDPYLETPTETQLEDALNAALVVGDDHIQEMSGFSNPESFTHGSSAQRQFWFANGYESGLGVCDTFAVPDSQLEAG